MTHTEDRIRELLRDVADEARPAPLLARLDQRIDVARRGRRWRFTALATAAAVAAAVLGVLVAARIDGPPEIVPAERPPKVFRLSDASTMRPGRVVMAVMPAIRNQTPGVARPYVLTAGRGSVVTLPLPTDTSGGSLRLSADGTRLVRTEWAGVSVINLQSGDSSSFAYDGWSPPELSPDNRMLATFEPGGVELVDVGTGDVRTLRRVELPAHIPGVPPPRTGLGWSPDGRTLAISEPQGLTIVDLRGRVTWRATGATLANLSMSWSPDGRSLLVYDTERKAFAVKAVHGGEDSVLRAPTDVARPLGWAGNKVVWLTGRPGAQRLVTTDRHGDDPRTWMQFDVGGRPIDSVTWSSRLSGAPVIN